MEEIKKPHNYGLTPEEQELAKYKELNERDKREREEREERERDEQEATTDRMKKQKEWNAKSGQIKQREVEILDTQSAPLRNYLMTHVMPTLTKALIGILNILIEFMIELFVFRMFSITT
jgi:adenylate kinase